MGAYLPLSSMLLSGLSVSFVCNCRKGIKNKFESLESQIRNKTTPRAEKKGVTVLEVRRTAHVTYDPLTKKYSVRISLLPSLPLIFAFVAGITRCLAKRTLQAGKCTRRVC